MAELSTTSQKAHLIIQENNAKKDIWDADRKIKKRTRYPCGLTEDIMKCEDAVYFFESPDGQNYELRQELIKKGWEHNEYSAPYYWKLRKGALCISFVEGDVYIKPLC